MTRYNPRNRNERRYDAPKSTASWFDARRNVEREPIGFVHHHPTKD